jgi:ribosomal protein L11 methylase PrmA
MTQNAFSHRPPKSWLKITLTVPGDKVDHLAAFLTDLSGGGIEQIPDPENQALETVIGYLPVDRELTEKKQRLNDFCSHLLGKPAPGGTGCFSSEIIEEEDWGRTWKKQFKPLEITPHLVIKPTGKIMFLRPIKKSSPSIRAWPSAPATMRAPGSLSNSSSPPS